MMDTQDILTSVKNRYGIDFRETMTGGGCMALEARLESGHWIVATDENLMGFRERIAYEAEVDADGETTPMGWFIGIYHHDPDNDTWMGNSEETLIDVTDYDAYADALPDMVGRALAALVSN